jgi:hypothetical protein
MPRSDSQRSSLRSGLRVASLFGGNFWRRQRSQFELDLGESAIPGHFRLSAANKSRDEVDCSSACPVQELSSGTCRRKAEGKNPTPISPLAPKAVYASTSCSRNLRNRIGKSALTRLPDDGSSHACSPSIASPRCSARTWNGSGNSGTPARRRISAGPRRGPRRRSGVYRVRHRMPRTNHCLPRKGARKSARDPVAEITLAIFTGCLTLELARPLHLRWHRRAYLRLNTVVFSDSTPV